MAAPWLRHRRANRSPPKPCFFFFLLSTERRRPLAAPEVAAPPLHTTPPPSAARSPGRRKWRLRRGPSRRHARPPECERAAVEGLLVGALPHAGHNHGDTFLYKLWLGGALHDGRAEALHAAVADERGKERQVCPLPDLSFLLSILEFGSLMLDLSLHLPIRIEMLLSFESSVSFDS